MQDCATEEFVYSKEKNMKKYLMMMLAVFALGTGSLAAIGADLSAKETQAQDLRTQALKAQLQADKLTAEAVKLEKEIVESEAKAQAKPGEKMRGYGVHACVMDCISGSNGGNLYSCRRACGAY